MRDRKRGTVRDLRRDNRAAVLWTLYLDQPRSRQDLSAATGLADSDGGRPRAMLGMNPEYGYVIGVDIGETRTRVELFDLTMAERAKAEYPLDPYRHEVNVVVTQILSGLDAVLRDSGVDPASVLGVGIGVPGIIEQLPEVLVHGQTYGWDAVPLGRMLRAGTDLPLHFDNGAKTMGQAEMWFGAGRGARNAVVVLIGSGVGASLIFGGTTYRGATSSAAELGHIVVVVGGRKCRCGATGCLEAYAGAEAILERYGRPMAADDQEAALAELIDAAGTSVLAAAILEETAEYLGAAIASLINLLNPERVILGGWAGQQLAAQWLPAIRESARLHSLHPPFAATSIELGRLGSGAVALGAATLPMESFLNGARAKARAAGPAAGWAAGPLHSPCLDPEHATRGITSCLGPVGDLLERVHLELPQGVAVLGRPRRPVHADVAASAGQTREGLRAAGAGGRGVDGRPGHVVGGHLDLERDRVGGLPVQRDPAGGLGAPEVNLQPLRVSERAGPPGTGVPVGGRRGRGTRILGGRRRRWLVQRGVGGAAGPAAACCGGEGLQLPQGVAVRGGPRRPVHADVAAGAGQAGQRLGAAGARRGRVDGRPGRVVGGRLDLERGRVGRLPVQGHPAERLGGAEVNLQPLRVSERARPPGTGVPVRGRRGRGTRVLRARRGRRLVQRHVGSPARPATAAASGGQRPLLARRPGAALDVEP